MVPRHEEDQQTARDQHESDAFGHRDSRPHPEELEIWPATKARCLPNHGRTTIVSSSGTRRAAALPKATAQAIEFLVKTSSEKDAVSATNDSKPWPAIVFADGPASMKFGFEDGDENDIAGA